jgi:LPXTG-motif cell wall-anchored protein
MTRQMRGRAVAAAGLLATTTGLGLLLGAVPAGGQTDPLGNNGTVKVDDVPFDDHPDNEPHVGCTFQIDFYGYDEGDLSATVLFEAIPPTVDDWPDGTDLLTDELDIGEDAAGGGTDLDASETYDLTDALAAIEPHPVQGWHVKLTVNAEGSQGADVKHKVFWVQGCEVPGTTPTTSSTTTTTKPGGTTTTVPGTTTTTKPGATTTTVPGATTSTTLKPSEETTTTVAGVSPTGPTTTEGGLPKTGSTTGPLVAAGLALVTVGAAVLGVLRLRRTA